MFRLRIFGYPRAQCFQSQFAVTALKLAQGDVILGPAPHIGCVWQSEHFAELVDGTHIVTRLVHEPSALQISTGAAIVHSHLRRSHAAERGADKG